VVAALSYGAVALYAISGGPQYPVSTDLSGSYAGVFKPAPAASVSPGATPTPTPSCSPSTDQNTLGVFSLAVPQSNLATGTFVLFSQGRIYTGSISGEADPTRAALNAVLQGSPAPTPNPTPIAASIVNGTVHARATHTITAPFSSVGVQIRGQALLEFEDNATSAVCLQTQSMRVRGFKQSAGTSLAATPIPSATPTPTP